MLWRSALALLVLATSANAAVIETALACPDFTLPATGEVIKNSQVITYNTVSKRVTIRMGKDMKALPLDVLPESMRQTLLALPVPAETKQEIALEEKQAEAVKEARLRRTMTREERLETEALDEAQIARAESRRLAIKKAELEMEEQIYLPRDIAAAALAYTHRLYPSFVPDGVPEVVPGWPNRWRVRGRYQVPEYYHSGELLTQNSKNLEVTLNVDPQKNIRVVEINKY